MKNRIFSSHFSHFPLSYFFLTFLTYFAVNIASAQIPSSGLVGYWPFNGNANDESGNGNNGTVNGPTLTTDRFGNANSAYSFGAGNVLIPLTQQMVSMPERTISLWFRSTSNQGGGRLFEATNVSWGAACYNSNNIDCWYQKSNQAYNIVQQTFPSNNIWYNLVYTCDSTNQTKKLYLNGVLINSGAPVSNPGNPTAWINHFLKIGQGLANESFAGQIDDIAIYDRSLTSSEIAQIYTSQTSAVQPACPTLATNLQIGLVGYWPFCGNANDESGNGSNGTVNGATLTTDRFGNPNSAYSFDGVNDFIQTSNISFANGGDFSISTWVNLAEAYANGFPQHYILANNAAGGGIYLNTDGNLSQFGCYDINITITLNNWHHFVAIKSGINYNLYIDNVFVGVNSNCNTNFINGVPIYFGNSSVNSEFTHGKIDDISIYNRAITPAEISQLYTNPSTTPPVACTPFLGEDQTVCAGTSVTLSASSTSSSAACLTLPSNLQNGLVGYWPFCGNANDASGNGNNGTVNGATLTIDRFGNSNSAYSFDGVNDGIITPDYNFPYGNSNRTMSFWMKNENTGNSCSVPVRYGIHSNSSAMWILHNNSCNPLYAYGSVVVDFYNNFLVSQTTVPNNEWHFISLTTQGQSCKLYIDGILQGETTTSFSTISSNGSFYIGADLVTPGGLFFNGLIDDISIYNRALTAPEIQQLYTLGQSTYLWSTGATTAIINVTPTTTTTYTCTVTDANGNACTDSLTVFVPQIEASDLTICAGETTTLSVSGINSTATPSACPTLPTNLQNGLVGYWPFCGNANDASGNGNNGTVNGATLTTDRFGNANSAYSFNPNLNSHIVVPFSSSIGSIQSGLTISAWVYMSGGTGNARVIEIQGYLGGNGNAGFALLPHSNSDVSRQFECNWYKAQNSVSIWPTNEVPSMSWHNIIYTADGASAVGKFYLDGQLISNNSLMPNQSPIVGGCTYNNNSLFIGADPSIVGKWGGYIDDVCLYNRFLSDNEIQQLYSNSSATYLWSNGATTPTINVSPTSTTTYTCTVTTNGVSCTDSVTVVVNNPVIDLGADVTVCGSSTTFTAPAGYDTYLWSNGGTTNTTTVIANGTYSCTITQGGCSATDAVDVTLIDATIIASDTIICAGETVTLSVPQGGTTSTACATLPANLQTGLVGYWPFCGNANDASGNGNNGTVNGATLTTDRFGNANCAYAFDGNDLINIGNSPVFNIVGNYSISYWYLQNTGGMGTVLSKDNGGGNQNKYVIGTNQYGTNGDFLHWHRTTETVGQWRYTGNSVGTSWNNIVWRFNTDNIELYRNGTLYQTYSYIVPIPTNISADLLIGSAEGGFFYNGVIDDLSFYNRALSASEIQQLFALEQTTYVWSNGATTPTINVSPTLTTTYTCTVTTNGVSCTDSVTVVVSNPVIDLGADVTVCGTSTTLTAPSGYDSYLWSNGGTTNTTTVTSNGTYSCTVTQVGCSASDSIDVILIDATITASDTIICAGESVTLSVPQGGANSTACAALPTNLQTGLVGYWPFCGNANDASGNGNNGTVNGATLTTDRFGNANSAYYFNGSSSMVSCGYNSAFNLTGNQTISYWYKAEPNPNNAFSSILSKDNGGGPQNKYIFGLGYNGVQGDFFMYGPTPQGFLEIHPANQVNSEWNFITWVFSPSEVKLYRNGIYVQSFSMAYSVPFIAEQLVIGASENSFFWKGEIDDVAFWNRQLSSSEILVMNNSMYSWSNGATTPTINVSPSATTTYTCTVTTNGVSCTDEITVVVSQPVASITPNGIVEICQGQSIALTANGGTSYLWNTGAPTQSITVNTEALYTITVTDANGCTDTESQYVKVNFLPNIGVNNSAICAGQSATLTATGGLSYVWSPATGLSSTTGTTVTASPSTSTVYNVTGTGANGCTNTASAAVAVNALPTATITPSTATTFCQGGSVVLNANTGTGLSYQWYNNASAISGATSASYTANASGSYTVVVTNASACSATSTAIVVTVNALPTATITPATATTFCQGGSVVLNANTGTGLTYQWRLNGTNITGATSSSYTANASGSYTVLVTNASLCSTTSTAIEVTTVPNIDYFADADGDGFGDASTLVSTCVQPNGYVTNNNDCNDNNANQNTASAEICNGLDDDCDGVIDNGITFFNYYADADGDGFGAGDVISSCSDLGAGYSTNNTDCNDGNGIAYPNATETCNNADDNCDGQIDEGVQTVYFIDNDGDTYGNPSVSILACVQPIGYTPDDNDCNDTDANINPGAEDIGGNGIDENCDGEIDNSIFELNTAISLYPNPTRSELNIQVNSSIIGSDLYIFDAVGKLVYKQQLLSTQTNLPVSNFADGNYIARVGEVVKRFVVEK